ncbi:MAG: hypothetical protein LBV61_05975, partial [Burkholderiaceae bacterium]|nr:hypothetical protein [Burkholderiaceae bacterium]
MRSLFLALHLIFAAIWLGCILTEALFERVLLAGDRTAHLTLARLHVRVDNFVELPAILIVLGTGLAMLSQSWPRTPSFFIMAFSGAAAIGLNFFCIWLVYKRRSAASAGSWSEFERLDHIQHKAGAGVLLFVLLALIAGVWSR